jgi:heme/copper-type cytochrome/quinol oxidase subunit 3
VSAEPGRGQAPVAEDPAILSANLSVGVRLTASAIAFVFVAFVFAFFYLRAVNSNGLWRPAHTSPSAGYGIVMLVCVLGSTALLDLARRQLGSGADRGWVVCLGVALALGILFLAIQVLQYTNFGFAPYDGGYASVFVGWTAMFLFFWLGALYWMETLLAQSLRRDPKPVESEIRRPLEVLGPSADACLVYLLLMSTIELVAYVLLYLIK